MALRGADGAVADGAGREGGTHRDRLGLPPRAGACNGAPARAVVSTSGDRTAVAATIGRIDAETRRMLFFRVWGPGNEKGAAGGDRLRSPPRRAPPAVCDGNRPQEALNLKSSVAVPVPSTFALPVWVPNFSCHASTEYSPGGRSLIVNVPSAPDTAKNGFSATPM